MAKKVARKRLLRPKVRKDRRLHRSTMPPRDVERPVASRRAQRWWLHNRLTSDPLSPKACHAATGSRPIRRTDFSWSFASTARLSRSFTKEWRPSEIGAGPKARQSKWTCPRPLLALSRHAQLRRRMSLRGKTDVDQPCLPISIYEYTP